MTMSIEPEGILTGEMTDEQDAEIAQAVEQEENEFLERMADDTEGAETPTDARERNEKGQFAAKNKEETEASDATESEDTDQPSGEESVNPDDYRKAIRALQRDGVPDETIDAMDKSKLTAWGLKRAENQANVDGYAKRLSELEKERSGVSKDSDPEQPTTDTPNLEPILNEVKELYGEELAEPLDKISKLLAEQFNTKLKEQSESLQQMKNSMVRQQMAEARAKYAEEWGLERESNYARVEEAMMTLDRTGQFESIDALTEAACRFALSGPELQRLKSNLAGEHKTRKNGQSTPAKRAAKPDAPNKDDLEESIHRAIFDGDTEERDRVARALGKGKQKTSWLDLDGVVGE